MSNDDVCTYKEGELPVCAPLALSFVPMQTAAEPVYPGADALAQGTLFPGLNLPFLNYIADSGVPATPLSELMALDFVTHELELYLDTHKADLEAFAMWKKCEALAAEGRKRYVAQYGPVTPADAAAAKSWNWPDDPWPWDFSAKRGNS